MIKKYIVLAAIVSIVFSGCGKDPAPAVTNPPTTGNMSVTFENVAGNEPLALETTWYKNENGDSIKITTFNYFISNIKLVKEDGTVFAETESYHLIEESKSVSKKFTIGNIPFGKYKSISFIIGVDSARNVSGAQTGALDQSSGMFWDWNTGYVMAKMEAESPQATKSSRSVIYHLAGFSGEINVLRTVTLQLPAAEVSSTNTPNLHIKADALEWFKTPNLINVKDLSILAGKNALTIADNYADMFSVEHVD